MGSPDPRVVVIGAGFRGLAARKALDKAPVEVTVVDQNNHHVFTPFRYQVATALLEADDAAHPSRSDLRRLPNVSFKLGTVKGADLDAKMVRTDAGVRTRWLVLSNWASDYLIRNRPARLIAGPRTPARAPVSQTSVEGPP